MLKLIKAKIYTGCPKKVTFKLIFEFLSFGGVFLGVKKF